MSKTAGFGDNLYIGGYDLSSDVTAVTRIGGGPATLDVTPINASAYVRLGGLRDGVMEFTTAIDPALNAEHTALSPLPVTDVICTYFRGTAAGNDCASCNGRQVNYDWTRGTDGMLAAAVQVTADGYGVEWGTQLTAGIRTDTAATAGTAFDLGAGTAFGAQAYLQVFGFTGTDATVKIQHATTSGGSYSDLIAFNQTTAGRGGQRAATANNATVNEFLKVTTVTTGGFTSLAFAVQITVNPIAGQVF